MYLRVEFPSGRFFGALEDAPQIPEWPPHPSRLFSALVAAAYRSGDGMTEQRRTALEWLERLPPPAISAPHADLCEAPTVYVPPADSVGRKGKRGEERYEHGVHRWRQPRHFPSAVLLGDPVVYYHWRLDLEERLHSLITTLADIAAGVTHVGTSHSMALVQVDAGTARQPATWVPDALGEAFLRVPIAGRLAELDAVFEQTSGVRRPASAGEPLVGYRRLDRVAEAVPGRMELITLRVSGAMQGADTAAYLGRAVRRAVMSVLGDDAPAVVHGHADGDHVGWLPLPDVGHPHARGRVVGLGVALPRGMDAEQRRQVLVGLAQLNGVHLPDGRTVDLSRPMPGERIPATLATGTWVRPSHDWATVTPVVLDRPPKRLTEERLRTSIADSLELAGYPRPEQVEVAAFGHFQGSPPAFRVPVQDRKPRFHAVVRFADSIAGPVIAGRLRYFGVGLFRPLTTPRAQ